MKKLYLIVALTIAIASTANSKDDYTKWVNPFIGTQHEGHCFPGATVPMGMVQASPESYNEYYKGYEMDHIAGYQYDDPYLWGFTQTHLNGVGCPSMSDILMMPTTKGVATNASRESFKSSYNKSSEVASPGYYTVFLDAPQTKVELTATERAAYHRYTYDNPAQAALLIDLQYGVKWDFSAISENILEASQKFEDEYTLTGYRMAQEWTQRKLFYVIKFNKRITNKKELIAPNGKTEKAPRYILEFAMDGGDALEIQIGLSTTSIESAKTNLSSEINGWNGFEKIRAEAKDKWNEILSKIQIEGDEQKTTAFYTSLYHLYIQPNNIADIDGQYRSADNNIYKSSTGKFYSTLSLWDTFRTANPLYTILTPAFVGDLITSMMEAYNHKPFDKNNPFEANKYLPRWQLWGRETNVMVGNHAIPIIVDAWIKGIKSDVYTDAEVYDAMKVSLSQPHYRNHVELIDQYGYIPSDKRLSAIDDGRETVARLLENIYDDYCLAKISKTMNKNADYEYFSKKGDYYKNIYDKESGFMRGRYADGRFKSDVNPREIVGEWLEGSDFTEGNSWHYLFHVLHDVDGMMQIMGGEQAFITKLDSMFLTKSSPELKTLVWNIYGTVGQYWHGNEPCHHVPYLYKYTSSTHKADAIIKFLVDDFYRNEPGGLKGNDDCGQMSAWYMCAVMGFYPVNPCGGEYIIGAPQVRSAAINLPNGKRFEIEAKNLSDKNFVVKKVRLNGKLLDRNYITHNEIMVGGKLTFEMESNTDASEVLNTLREGI